MNSNLTITINRFYGSLNDVGVYFEFFDDSSIYEETENVNSKNNLQNRMELREGLITFKEGETSKLITFKIFPIFINEDFKENKFILSLYGPLNGCYLGQSHAKSIIEIFDNSVFIYVDLNFTIFKLEGLKFNPLKYAYDYFQANSGTLIVSSFYSLNKPKQDGNDNFFLSIFNQEDSLVFYDRIPYYNLNNYVYNLNYFKLTTGEYIKELYLSVSYCAEDFIRTDFYDSAGFIKEELPFFTRNVQSIYTDEFCKKI